MLSGLILTAFLMGLGGVPHCAAMCGAACAALLPKGVPLSSLAGRCAGYALLGAVAAASAGMVAQWGRQVAFLQPLWVLALAAAMLLGLMLLWRGAMPRQVDVLGQDLYRALKKRLQGTPLTEGTQARRGPMRGAWTFAGGMAWAMLPCGLLYAALMVAALAPTAAGGAMVMLAFAVPGAFGVWGAPFVLRRLADWGKPARLRTAPLAPLPGGVVAADAAATAAGAALVPILWMKRDAALASGPSAELMPAPIAGSGTRLLDPRWAVRLSGLMLAAMSAWALYLQIVAQWRAWCA